MSKASDSGARADWFLVSFQSGAHGEQPWSWRLLSPGYRHVTVAAWMGKHPACWIIMSWTRHGLQITPVSGAYTTGLVRYLKMNATSIVMVDRQNDRMEVARAAFLSCVEAAKHMIGIAEPDTITPLDLHRRLLERGGQEVWRWDS